MDYIIIYVLYVPKNERKVTYKPEVFAISCGICNKKQNTVILGMNFLGNKDFQHEADSHQSPVQSKDAFCADPNRTLVVDLDQHRVLPPSKVNSKTVGKRFVVLTVTMALDAEHLTVRFGKGPKNRLVVRELLDKKQITILAYIYEV